MDMSSYKKHPRLYTAHDLGQGGTFTVSDDQAHYLRNVLRKNAGESVRLFNGRDGEWTGILQSADKKAVTVLCDVLIRKQPERGLETHLLFAPIKKARLDFLVEKAVELGATHLHPLITQNAENRQLNDGRLKAQCTEAAEQCERLDIPELSPAALLEEKWRQWPGRLPVLACLERSAAQPLMAALTGLSHVAVLVGPEGGFTAEEAARLQKLPFVTPVSLGPLILRSETAACSALAAIGHYRAG